MQMDGFLRQFRFLRRDADFLAFRDFQCNLLLIQTTIIVTKEFWKQVLHKYA